MRPIDADKLKAHYSWWNEERREVFDAIVDMQPTIDAVEVVRCNDCKRRGMDDCPMHIKGVEPDEDFIVRVDNDYCSYGERKGGDE